MNALLEFSELPELNPLMESERLDALRSLNLLDTPKEDRFDRITHLAAKFFQAPISYVALIDHDRQWFKSSHGLCMAETGRAVSFCQYTIRRDGPFIIHDTHLHPFGQNHPLVVGEPFVRFYAGVPLVGPNGQKIGSFCLLDIQPRTFTEIDIAHLVAFASIIEREVNLGQIIQTQNELLATREQLLKTQEALRHELSDAAKYVRLMIPPPFTGDETIDWQFHPSTQLGGDGLGYRRINDDQLAIYVLDVTGHGFGSALLAVTALELLRNPAAQINFSKPATVLERLNRTFQMKDHAGKFFSAWYGVYSKSARTLTYANAGHPPAILLNHESGKCELHRTLSSGSVLGILPEIKVEVTTVSFPAESELFLFTDGLYEVLDPKGGRGSYAEFLVWIEEQTSSGRPLWNAMLQWLAQARENEAIDDDVSLLRFVTKT